MLHSKGSRHVLQGCRGSKYVVGKPSACDLFCNTIPRKQAPKSMLPAIVRAKQVKLH